MTVLVANNASATLAGSYNAAATALTVTAGQGALFPAPTGGDYFLATLTDASNHLEIIKCTARIGDTLTVVRAQESTAARAYNSGDKIEMRITAGLIAAIRDQAIDSTRIADGAITTPKLAASAVDAGHLADGAVDTAAIQDTAVTSAKLATGAALANLGFTPLEQGGAAGQNADKVHIGNTSAGKLSANVNGADTGYLLTEQTGAGAKSAGYRGVPQNVQNTDYTFALADTGGHVLHESASTHTYTIPTHVAVPFDPAGACILIVVDLGTVNIALAGGVTLKWAGTALTGPRTVAVNGMATLLQVATDVWYISGPGVS